MEPPQTVPLRPDGLQIDEDRAAQARHWRRERAAWIGFAAVVAAALLGAFGAGGPLSDGRATIGAVRVEVPRIARWQTGETLAIHLPPGPAPREVLIGQGLLDLFAVEAVIPEPLAMQGGEEGLRLALAATGGTLRLTLRPLKPGVARFRLGVDGRQARFTALVLP